MNSLRLKGSKNIVVVGLSGMVNVLRFRVRFGSNTGYVVPWGRHF